MLDTPATVAMPASVISVAESHGFVSQLRALAAGVIAALSADDEPSFKAGEASTAPRTRSRIPVGARIWPALARAKNRRASGFSSLLTGHSILAQEAHEARTRQAQP